MSLAQKRKLQWVITYDNPINKNYKAMPDALRKLGKLIEVDTKTTFILTPKIKVTTKQIRDSIRSNLDTAKGHACYVNLKSKKRT